MRKFKSLVSCLLLLGFLSCGVYKKGSRTEANFSNMIPYRLIKTLPHDEEAYTQGLVYHKGKLYESTGSKNSWVAVVNQENGEQDKKVVLDKKYFGEGITILNNKIYQLTWKDKQGFIYDVNTFNTIGEFTYDFEGWGITTDGRHLIVSDGTEKIYYLDTLNFEVVKTLEIYENNVAVHQINELEYIGGYIFANQYETNYLLKINPETEQVVGRVDLTPLAKEVKRKSSKANVLNGIAWNAQTGEILVTGKQWPKAFIIELKEEAGHKKAH